MSLNYKAIKKNYNNRSYIYLILDITSIFLNFSLIQICLVIKVIMN